MQLRPRNLLALAGALLMSAAAVAAPVVYNEVVDGDLPAMAGAPMALDVGANTISGTTHFFVNDGTIHFDPDFDSFGFTLGSGLRLSGITLSFVTTSFNALKATADFVLCASPSRCLNSDAAYLGVQQADFLAASPEVFDFGGSLPLGPGTYSLSHINLGIAPISALEFVEKWSTDYTWTLSVEAVPEPNSLALAGLACVCLLLAQRRAGPVLRPGRRVGA